MIEPTVSSVRRSSAVEQRAAAPVLLDPERRRARTGYVSSGSTVVSESSVVPQRSRKVAPSSASGRSVTAATGARSPTRCVGRRSSTMRLPMKAAARARP